MKYFYVKLSENVYRPAFGGLSLLFAEAVRFFAMREGVEVEVAREFHPNGDASGRFSATFGLEEGEARSAQQSFAFTVKAGAEAFATVAESEWSKWHVDRLGRGVGLPDTTSLGGRRLSDLMRLVDSDLVEEFLALVVGVDYAPTFKLYRVAGAEPTRAVVAVAEFRSLSNAVLSAVRLDALVSLDERFAIVDGEGRRVDTDTLAMVEGRLALGRRLPNPEREGDAAPFLDRFAGLLLDGSTEFRPLSAGVESAA